MEVFGLEFLSSWHFMALGVLLVAAEALVPGILLLWFGAGFFAVGAFLWVWPEAPLGVQILALSLFLVASVFCGLRFQDRAKAREGDSELNKGLAAMKGRKGTAASTFTHHGRVYVGDSFYSAYAPNEVKEGETVTVADVRDGVLYVEPLAN